jgi:sulfoxide reductase heme-binding subunit YedZ
MNDTILWYTTRGSGAISLVLLTGVVALGVLTAQRFEAKGWPRFLTAGLHRNIALLALIFLSLHIVTAIADPFTHLGWVAALIPFSSYYRTFWLGLGTIAAELLAAIVVTSLVRGVIGRSAWKAIHGLAYASWPVAVVHGLGTGTDRWAPWFFALTLMCVAIAAFAVAYRLASGSSDPLTGPRMAFRSGVERKAQP